MASSLRNRPAARSERAFFPPTLTLAGQRARKTWGLLLLVELGLLGAILLACVVPLYANVAMTAALRSTLNAQDSFIAVHTSPQLISQAEIANATRMLDHEATRVLGNDLQQAQFSLQSQPLQILTPGPRGILQQSAADMNLVSEDLQQASAHLRLIAGRLPRDTAPGLEIALTLASAQALHLSVGSTLPVQLAFDDVSSTIYPQTLNLRVSGLFAPDTSAFYWHGNTFAPSLEPGTHYYALVSNQALMQSFDQLSSAASRKLHFFVNSPTVIWSYQIDPSHLTIDDLNSLFYGIQQIQLDNANNAALEQEPYLEQTQTVLSIPGTLNGLLGRIAIIEFPVISLVALIIGLLLFFLVVIINLLIEHQGEAIALLRGRGATRQQILAALTLQGLMLTLLAFVLGIVLAPWVVRGLTWQMFGTHDQNALNILAGGGPFKSAQLVGIYALVVAGVALITIVSAAWSAARSEIVAWRRETARSSQRPLWQRLRLDILALFLALAGYGAAFYLLNSNALGSQLYLFLLAPLALLQTLFLLLAALLFILRFYPDLLRLSTKLMEHRRGAAPILALAQIARAPRQSARVTLLLALTSAFAIFALVFTATQAQRVQDVASYQAGADFSGTLPAATYTAGDFDQATALYNRVPGVLASSVGLSTQAQAGALSSQTIQVQAVDASTFAQAASWSAQDSSQALSSLMQQLREQRPAALAHNIVPALVDTNTWDTLKLSQNRTFVLNFSQLGTDRLLELQVVARVQHIPTAGDSATPEVLVDYPTLARVYAQKMRVALNSAVIAPSTIWLRTRSDARSLASVRAALTAGQLRLTSLADRRAIQAALYADPIYLTLLGELELGAITALFLALLGCLVASWLSVRSRLLNFVTLRALGATTRQITATLAWEQGIIYTAALLLGILVGSLLSALSLPSLVLTSVLSNQDTSNANFYAAQSIPPLQFVIPSALWLILGALIVLCLLALGLMLSRVTRSSISMALRLSED